VWTPVLMLTSRDGRVGDRVTGLDGSGGDDYLPKPFSLSTIACSSFARGRGRAPTERPSTQVGDLRLIPPRTLPPRLRGDHGARPVRAWIRVARSCPHALSGSVLTPRATPSRELGTVVLYELRSNIVDVYIRQLREKDSIRPFGSDSIETSSASGIELLRTRGELLSDSWARRTLASRAIRAAVLAAGASFGLPPREARRWSYSVDQAPITPHARGSGRAASTRSGPGRPRLYAAWHDARRSA